MTGNARSSAGLPALPAWVDADDRACVGADTELFYAHDAASVAAAKEFCFRCPYVGPCFRYAVEADENGVWGASDRDERKRWLRRRRQRAAMTAARAGMQAERDEEEGEVAS